MSLSAIFEKLKHFSIVFLDPVCPLISSPPSGCYTAKPTSVVLLLCISPVMRSHRNPWLLALFLAPAIVKNETFSWHIHPQTLTAIIFKTFNFAKNKRNHDSFFDSSRGVVKPSARPLLTWVRLLETFWNGNRSPSSPEYLQTLSEWMNYDSFQRCGFQTPYSVLCWEPFSAAVLRSAALVACCNKLACSLECSLQANKSTEYFVGMVLNWVTFVLIHKYLATSREGQKCFAQIVLQYPPLLFVMGQCPYLSSECSNNSSVGGPGLFPCLYWWV